MFAPTHIVHITLGLLLGCSAEPSRLPFADAGPVPMDAFVEEMDPDVPAVPVDSGTDVDTPVTIDGGPMTSDVGPVTTALGGRWLDSVAARGAAFCECETAVRDYESVAECTAAEGSAGAGECAGATLLALTDLHAGFECLADAFETQAACMTAAACDRAALNACEAAAAPIIAECPPTEEAPLTAFFAGVGECVRGAAGVCPEQSGSGLGEVATGSTLVMGNEFAPSCAAGADVAPDVSVQWQAPSTGMYRFDTFGSSFDTQLAIFAGCAGDELACNDDAGDRRTSSIDYMVTEGEVLVLVVDGFDELSVGDFVLNVRAL